MRISTRTIIEEWSNELSTLFGRKGKNIAPDDRVRALIQLFQELKKEGYQRSDLDFDIKSIVRHCIPTDPKLRNEGWVFKVISDIRNILEETYPNSEPTKKFIDEVEDTCKSLGVKFTKRTSKARRVEREEREERVEVEKPKRFNFEKVTEEEVKKVSRKTKSSLIQLDVEDIEDLAKTRYTISKEVEEQKLLPKVDREIMELFGLNEDGELQ